MPTVIEAALVGDSHCRAIEEAAAAQDISFRQVITAASPLFHHATFTQDSDGQVCFTPTASHFDATQQPANRIANKRSKAQKLTTAFRKLFANPLPVFISVGTGAHAFVSQITSAQDAAGLNDPFVSQRLAEKAADAYLTEYRAFYQVIAQYCPQVAFLYAPTRFTPRTRTLWQAHDTALASALSEMGVTALDLRSALGDKTGALRPEYWVENTADQVHANTAWGAEVIAAIRTHPTVQLAA